jgi:phosphatidate cytidylyltransferase
MFSFILHLRKMPGEVQPFFVPMSRGAALAILLAMGNSMSDVASFFIGKYLGRHKLCPNISPGKTIEGSLGSLVITTLFVLYLGYLFHFPTGQSLAMACVIVVAAQFGDLWESVLKRDVGVKDSGDLVVGHGGIMDRFDSLTFAAPLLYLYVKYFFS